MKSVHKKMNEIKRIGMFIFCEIVYSSVKLQITWCRNKKKTKNKTLNKEIKKPFIIYVNDFVKKLNKRLHRFVCQKVNKKLYSIGITSLIFMALWIMFGDFFTIHLNFDNLTNDLDSITKFQEMLYCLKLIKCKVMYTSKLIECKYLNSLTYHLLNILII